MKILFVSDTYYPHINGVYYFVCRIAPLLQDRGHTVAVVAPSSSAKFTETRIDNILVYGLPSFPVFYYPKFRIPSPVLVRRNLKKIIQLFMPDIIHVQDHFLLGKNAIKIALEQHIPIIGTNHFMPENITALLKWTWLRKFVEVNIWSNFSNVYNQLELVTTPTETAAELIRPKLKTKVIALSSGVDLSQFFPDIGSTDIRAKYKLPDKPLLIFVGRLDPEKNLAEVVRAVAIALQGVDFSFLVVGRGLEKVSLEALAKELNIEKNIIFTGFVPEQDLPLLYQTSRCFIIASTAELLSLGTLQAMASGLPIIAVEAGALPELVRHNVNGYLFHPGNIKAIVSSIYNIFSSPSLALKMGEKSVGFARQHDINNIATEFFNLYQAMACKNLPQVDRTVSI